ncbi:hypothetical protein [Ostreibacterium oceani]|nr:hypothetical protein [Ostreibacterium oceani]
MSVTRGGQEGQQFVQQNAYDLENRRIKKTVNDLTTKALRNAHKNP